MSKQRYNDINISLAATELMRYARHFTLPNVGLSGQQKLKSARVLCVGAGGLGSPLLLYLAAAGVGTIGIVDHDVVELSNLQRQVLYTMDDLNIKKVHAAKARLLQLNPEINIVPHDAQLNKENILEIIQPYDIVADGTDNFATRYLINDACFHLKKPNVYASIFQFSGQCSVFTAVDGPCYRCLYDTPPPADAIPNCAEAGVFGVLPGLMGTLQATEMIKLILNIGSPLIGKLLTFDALTMRFQEFAIKINLNCRLCVQQQSFASLPNYPGVTCMTTQNDEISVEQLHKLRETHADFTLLDVREPEEYAICNLGGILIPLAQLPERLQELDPAKLTIVHCRSGGRSRKAVQLLQAANFVDAKNLTGGISAWIKQIDPKMQSY